MDMDKSKCNIYAYTMYMINVRACHYLRHLQKNRKPWFHNLKCKSIQSEEIPLLTFIHAPSKLTKYVHCKLGYLSLELVYMETENMTLYRCLLTRNMSVASL